MAAAQAAEAVRLRATAAFHWVQTLEGAKLQSMLRLEQVKAADRVQREVAEQERRRVQWFVRLRATQEEADAAFASGVDMEVAVAEAQDQLWKSLWSLGRVFQCKSRKASVILGLGVVQTC